jgi:ribosomal protein S18 acetylase RimI-like enzyme
MNTEPQFRLAAETDAGTLLRFMREYYVFDGHGFEEQQAHVALIGLLRDAKLGRVWLILDGGGAVGYVVLCFGYSLEWLGRDAFVDELYLLEEYRRRGWGRKTIEFVEQEARSAGLRTLHLEVMRQNTAALEVYQRLGFAQHDSRLMSKWIAKDLSKPLARNRH